MQTIPVFRTALQKEFGPLDREFTNHAIALGWSLQQAKLFWQKGRTLRRVKAADEEAMNFIYRVIDPEGVEHKELDRERFKVLLAQLQEQFPADAVFELSADVIVAGHPARVQRR